MNKQWTEIYGCSLENLVGRDQEIKSINNYINNFQNNNRHILIYGGIGTGKTVLVNSILQMKKFKVKKISSDVSRSKKNIDDYFYNMHNSLDFIDGKFVTCKNKCLFFDDIDSINQMDTGCISAIIDAIKKYKDILVIFTSHLGYNPQTSKLEQYCNIVECNPLTKNNMITLAKTIFSSNNNIKVSKKLITYLIDNSAGDARSFINHFEFLSKLNINHCDIQKDTSLSLWDCLNILFTKHNTINKSINLVKYEPRWIPNAIFENYINHNINNNADIHSISKQADLMADADTFEHFNNSNMFFEEYVNDYSYIIGVHTPCDIIKSNNKPSHKILKNIFPTYFGRSSNFKLNKNLLIDIKNNTNIKKDLDYMYYFKDIVFTLINNSDTDTAIDILNNYKFSVNYFNSIMRPNIFNSVDYRKVFKPKAKKYFESQIIIK